MSQNPGIVMIPNIPLFLFSVVCLALTVAWTIHLWFRLTDLRQWKREAEQEIRESEANLAKYVEISAQGLLSDRWEFMYRVSTPYTCILCGRNYLQFDYQVYRDNSHPETTILFSSHFCPQIKDMSPYEAQEIAGAYGDELQRFMDRFQLGEQPTELVPALELKQQRAIHGPRLTTLLEAMSE